MLRGDGRSRRKGMREVQRLQYSANSMPPARPAARARLPGSC